ncbi:guanylate kinase [Porticoccaceae bacterium]|nr:guanylate kinase [Porticoccaceae bacterium]MDG2116593.1 guanylate kinase [Porticoccaceae bacterium]
MAQGTLFIISAPSGAGKTSLVAEILARMDNIQASISHTTRAARSGETDAVNYHFVSQQTFHSMVADNAFLEHAEVFGNFYGTSRQWVQETLNAGTDVILEIDWQGAEQVRQQFAQSKSIFILPPSKQALRERLNGRAQDDIEVINKRIAAATEEMSHYVEADYLVINDDFDLALEQLKGIISAQRCKMPIQGHEKLLSDLLS